MIRLIERGLMFGNLFEVNSKALVERYNRALKHLTGKQTKLTSFHIDISGYAPEIGIELDDELYLNPMGCNRQFILLSTEQKSAPLLNAQFSTSRGILRQFIARNEAQLFALTARDAVAGELVNSVFAVKDPANLFQIRRIEIEADTTDSHVADARGLSARIEQFRNIDDAWWDDVLIADMIEMAKKSGDIVRNPVTLDHCSFTQDNFHTAHFGGLYVFRDVEHPAAIALIPPEKLGDLPIEDVLHINDANAVAQFLKKNDLAESIVSARNLDTAALLQQRLDFILVDTAVAAGADTGDLDRRALRAIARQNYSDLPPEFHALSDLLRWVQTGKSWPTIDSGDPAYFYTLRAANRPDRDLVNMLLAELTPMDVRQLFICNKAAFYRAYSGWDAAKKTYVANFLTREYAVDKAGARTQLFGPEPGMDAAVDPTPEPDIDIITQVGPWGAVRRRQ